MRENGPGVVLCFESPVPRGDWRAVSATLPTTTGAALPAVPLPPTSRDRTVSFPETIRAAPPMSSSLAFARGLCPRCFPHAPTARTPPAAAALGRCAPLPMPSARSRPSESPSYRALRARLNGAAAASPASPLDRRLQRGAPADHDRRRVLAVPHAATSRPAAPHDRPPRRGAPDDHDRRPRRGAPADHDRRRALAVSHAAPGRGPAVGCQWSALSCVARCAHSATAGAALPVATPTG